MQSRLHEQCSELPGQHLSKWSDVQHSCSLCIWVSENERLPGCVWCRAAWEGALRSTDRRKGHTSCICAFSQCSGSCFHPLGERSVRLNTPSTGQALKSRVTQREQGSTESWLKPFSSKAVLSVACSECSRAFSSLHVVVLWLPLRDRFYSLYLSFIEISM